MWSELIAIGRWSLSKPYKASATRHTIISLVVLSVEQYLNRTMWNIEQIGDASLLLLVMKEPVTEKFKLWLKPLNTIKKHNGKVLARNWFRNAMSLSETKFLPFDFWMAYS